MAGPLRAIWEKRCGALAWISIMRLWNAYQIADSKARFPFRKNHLATAGGIILLFFIAIGKRFL